MGRAGFAKIAITPPLGIELAGYGVYLERRASEVHDDPFIGYLPDREDFTAGGYASTLVPRILQMPPYSPAVSDALVRGALALIESLES